MKKLLIFITLTLSLGIYAQAKNSKKIPMQTAELKIQTNAKKYFEEVFVQKTFKDPYSYVLKKIWIEKANKKQIIGDSSNYYYFKILSIDKEILSRFGGAQSTRTDELEAKMRYKAKQIELENKLAEMSDVEKEDVYGYKVFFDTYGANSYGNKILGKYFILMGKNGERISEPQKIEN